MAVQPSAHIRPAKTEDLPGILAIVNQAILNTTAIYDYDLRSLEAQTLWFNLQAENGYPVLVALEGREVVGYGSYGRFRPKIGYQYCVEHSLYIKEGQQGKGIGTALLKELIRMARQQGMHTMIGGLDADNAGSLVFHLRHGFKEVGRLNEVGHKFGRRLDLLFLQLYLNEPPSTCK